MLLREAMLRAKVPAARGTPDGGNEDLVALGTCTPLRLLSVGSFSAHNLAVGHDMSVHPRVGVLAGRNRHRRVAQRAARRDSVRFRGIKLGALVFCRTEVVVAKGSSTEVAADREEVVLVAGRVGTRAAHKEHLGVGAVFAGRHCFILDYTQAALAVEERRTDGRRLCQPAMIGRAHV